MHRFKRVPFFLDRQGIGGGGGGGGGAGHGGGDGGGAVTHESANPWIDFRALSQVVVVASISK